MANKGISNIEKITLGVSNISSVVNLNKEEKNVHLVMPIVKAGNIDVTLIYNHEKRGELGMFGYGVRLGCLPYIKYEGSNEIPSKIEHPDGLEEGFIQPTGSSTQPGAFGDRYYTSMLSKMVIRWEDSSKEWFMTSIDDVNNTYESTFKKFGSYRFCNQLKLKNGEIITVTASSDSSNYIIIKQILSTEGDVVDFTISGGLVTKITYKKHNRQMMEAELLYNSSKYLRSIKYIKGENSSAKTILTEELTLDSNKIILNDLMYNQTEVYDIAASSIKITNTKIKKGNKVNEEINISYFNDYTLLRDAKNNGSYIFFDQETGLKSQVIGEEGYCYVAKSKVVGSNSVVTYQSDGFSFSPGDINKRNILGISTVQGFSAAADTSKGEKSSNYAVFDNIFRKATLVSGKKASTGLTGSLKYSKEVNLIAGDSATLCVFVKQLFDYTYYKNGELIINGDNEKKILFNNDKQKDYFELKTLTFSGPLKKIDIVINLYGGAEFEFGSIQLLKSEGGIFYNYDDSAYLLSSSIGGNSINKEYNDIGQVTSVISKSSYLYDVKYNDKGNIISGRSLYGVSFSSMYDNKERLTKEEVITSRSPIIENPIFIDSFAIGDLLPGDGINPPKQPSSSPPKLVYKNSYTKSGEDDVITKTDPLGNSVQTYTDKYGRLKKVISALNEELECKYDTLDFLEQVSLKKGAKEIAANYTYDLKFRLKTITLSNGSKYEYMYDDENNTDDIKSLKVNNEVMFTLAYDKIGNIIKMKYGTSADEYSFTYDGDDSDDKLIEIRYKDNLILEYIYNNELLKTIKNYKTNVDKNFIYNEYDELVEVKTQDMSTKLEIDNLGNIVNETMVIKEKMVSSGYDSYQRSITTNPEGRLSHILLQEECYSGMFNKTTNLFKRNGNKASAIVGLNIKENKVMDDKKEDLFGIVRNVGTLSLSSNTFLGYKIPNATGNNGCLGVWFRNFSLTSNRYLFSISGASTSKNSLVLIRINSNLKVEVIIKNGTSSSIVLTSSQVIKAEWNFVYLEIVNTASATTFRLKLNENIYETTVATTNYFILGNETIFGIGNDVKDLDINTSFIGNITGLLIEQGKVISDIDKFHNTMKDYIKDNQSVEGNNQGVNFSQARSYTEDVFNKFEVYPLNNTVLSLKGNKPIELTYRNVLQGDKDSFFNYNENIKRYAYVADGARIKYQTNMKYSGTIALRALVNEVKDHRYLFELKSEDDQRFGLYVDSSNYLVMAINTTVKKTTLNMTQNKFEFISLSFEQPNQQSDTSLGQASNTIVRLIVGEKSYTTMFSNLSPMKGVSVMIGGKDGSDKTKAINPLNGQIEMVCIGDAYCEDETITKLKTAMNLTNKITMYDELGLVRKTQIHKDNKEMILENMYIYETFNSNLTTRIKSQRINAGSLISNFLYTYDNNNNVTKIQNDEFGNKEYAYDYRGYLVKDNGVEIVYDDNGNITKYGSSVFTYDSLVKDLLKSVNGVQITYDPNNRCNPKSFGNIEYMFEGRSLVGISEGSKKITYLYDENKIRYSKNVNGVITKYYYNGSRLITEINNNYRNDFLYDECGLLYGFIYNNSSKYYYVRDILQNIVGIVDESGKVVVKYSYNAYGVISSIEDTSQKNIDKINPFKYKGYYYDEETGLFLITSNSGSIYYDPSISRWISSGEISNIDTGSINCLNLYNYCYNNPISYYCAESGYLDYIHFVENVRQKEYEGKSTKEIKEARENLAKKGRLTAEEKKEYGKLKKELKGRGAANVKKRKGYGHSKFNLDLNNYLSFNDFTRDYAIYENISNWWSNNWGKVAGGGLIIGGTVLAVYIIINDITIVGILDDLPGLAAAWGAISEGWKMIFG